MILSILGLYNFDNEMLDGLKFALPSDVDFTAVSQNIILNCAELEFIYPQASFAENAIAVWAKSRVNAWDRVYKALTAEYSPIENTDRYSEINETTVREKDISEERNGNSGLTGTTDSKGGIDGTSVNAESVAAYDSENFTNNNRNDITSKTEESNQTKTENLTSSHATLTNDEDEKIGFGHTEHTHGNIGVTTNQAMINEELKLRADNDFISYVVADFKKTFCILIY